MSEGQKPWEVPTPKPSGGNFPWVSSKSFSSLQAAVNSLKATGGLVAIPPGVIELSVTLILPANVVLMGAGRGATIITQAAGTNKDLIHTEAQGEGGAKGWGLWDLTIDGNKAANAAGGVILDGRTFSIYEVEFRNLPGQFLLEDSHAAEAENDESFGTNIRYMNNSAPLKFTGPHDSVFTNVMARDTGVNANIEALNTSTWTDCHAYGNSAYGIIAGANTNFVDCQIEGTTNYKLKIVGAGVRWDGGRIFSAGAEDAKKGIVIAAGTGHQLRNILIENCEASCINFEVPGENTCITGHIFGAEAKPAIVGIPATSVDALGLHVAEPMVLCEGEVELFSRILGSKGPLAYSSGSFDIGGRIAYLRRETDPAQVEKQIRVYSKNQEGKQLLKARFGAGTDIVLAKERLGVLTEVPSAEELTPTDEGPVTTIKVTGATEIKKIAALRAGLVLNLLFTGAAPIVNGNNLALKGNFLGGANRILSLECDGTNYIEIGRSPALGSEAAGALTARNAGEEFEPSSTRPTLVTGQFEGAAVTRTKVKVFVGGVVVFEGVISAANTGITAQPFCFVVPAGKKWKWEKVEGTVEANGFKTSYTIL